jgi:hypothetical protein
MEALCAVERKFHPRQGYLDIVIPAAIRSAFRAGLTRSVAESVNQR